MTAVEPVASPEKHFEALAEEFAGRPGVTTPAESGRRGFGSTALKVNGSIFAMLVGGRLVVKLPKDRVAGLIARGPARRSTPGRDGRCASG